MEERAVKRQIVDQSRCSGNWCEFRVPALKYPPVSLGKKMAAPPSPPRRIMALSRAVMHALGVLSIAGMAGSVSAAAVNWTLNADGFWDVVTNWSSNPALP